MPLQRLTEAPARCPEGYHRPEAQVKGRTSATRPVGFGALPFLLWHCHLELEKGPPALDLIEVQADVVADEDLPCLDHPTPYPEGGFEEDSHFLPLPDLHQFVATRFGAVHVRPCMPGNSRVPPTP